LGIRNVKIPLVKATIAGINPPILPILSETAVAYGVDKVEIARASIIGQPIHMLSPLVPYGQHAVKIGVIGHQKRKDTAR
jgi:Mg2+/citrate symporter